MRYYNYEDWCKLKGIEYKPMTDREFIDSSWKTFPMGWSPLGPLNAKTKEEFETWWKSNTRNKLQE